MVAHAAIGTRTFRNPDGSVTIVPPELDYSPEPGAVEIKLVRDITIRFPLDGAISAEIELYLGQNVPITAKPGYWTRDIDGKGLKITRIEFEDGSTWDLKN